MSLLDQNWGAGGNAEDEAQDDNQQGRQVKFIYLLIKTQNFISRLIHLVMVH
jgi:hypothetical protein